MGEEKLLAGERVPPDASLLPGTGFGPLVGSATGTFGSFFLQLIGVGLMRRESLARLQAEGVRELGAFPTELRFRQKNPLELLELEILPHGRLHPDCTPERPPTCSTCGRNSDRFPEAPIIDAASLPTHTDLFRLSDFETMLFATERIVDAVRRLGLDDVDIREVPVR